MLLKQQTGFQSCTGISEAWQTSSSLHSRLIYPAFMSTVLSSSSLPSPQSRSFLYREHAQQVSSLDPDYNSKMTECTVWLL